MEQRSSMPSISKDRIGGYANGHTRGWVDVQKIMLENEERGWGDNIRIRVMWVEFNKLSQKRQETRGTNEIQGCKTNYVFDLKDK